MQLLTYTTLVLTMLFWGGTFIAGRLLADVVAPVHSAFIRFSIASICLFLLTLLHDGKLAHPPRRLWLPLFLLGLTGVFSYNILFFTGLQQINAGRAALIIALNPLVISIFALFILGEQLNLKQFAGILLSLLGAVIVISNGQPRSIFHGGFGLGELALLGCVLSWSAYSIIGRSVLTTLSPLASVFYSAVIGSLLLLFPALYLNILHAIPAITVSGWLSLIYLGVFGTAIGFSLYYRAIKSIGPTRAGIFINLVPLFAIILSWLLLGETMASVVITGGIILLCGVTITNYCRG